MDGARISLGGMLLTTSVIDSDLGVGDTSTESRLRVGLVLLVSVTLIGSSSHFIGLGD